MQKQQKAQAALIHPADTMALTAKAVFS